MLVGWFLSGIPWWGSKCGGSIFNLRLHRACNFLHLCTKQFHLPTRARSLASLSQGMASMALRSVASYGMEWGDRSLDVR